MEVILNDSQFSINDNPVNKFAEIHEWALYYCSSYLRYKVVDVSDVSLTYDYIAVYEFSAIADEVQFKLRWQ